MPCPILKYGFYPSMWYAVCGIEGCEFISIVPTYSVTRSEPYIAFSLGQYDLYCIIGQSI